MGRESMYRLVRRKIHEHAPRTRLGRFTAYLLAVDVFLFVLQKVVALFSWRAAAASGLASWVSFLTFLVLVLGVILGFRWFWDKLLWRLRNRLVVTYVFIGVIPVVLIATIAGGAGYLFAGQFATYLASSDLQTELRTLETANATIASEYAHSSTAHESHRELPALRDQRWADRSVIVWQGSTPTVLQGPAVVREAQRPSWIHENFHGVIFDQGAVYLRVATTVQVNGTALTVVSSEPLDGPRLQQITGELGEVSLTDLSVQTSSQGISINSGGERNTAIRKSPGEKDIRIPSVRGGTLPVASGRVDPEFTFMALFPIVDWSDGQTSTEGLVVHSRASALYGRLFRTLGQLTQVIIYALLGTAVFFAVIELFALFIGLGLTRTITRSVAELYRGTQHVNRGDFSYRIPVRSKDQLAALESSFNSMNESLERLMAEQKEKERLQNELAIAQEVQAQLFPKQHTELESLEVYGICRPARTVSGDYYDFLPLGPDRLGLAVGDISGKGISAALLMATVHSAVRAYEFGRMPATTAHLVVAGGSGSTHVMEMTSGPMHDGEFSPASILTVLNRQLYHSTPSEKYATLFLSSYDAKTRTLLYSNAGHLPPVIIGAKGDLGKLDTPGLVVGLLDGQGYEERSIRLQPGDIFLAYSDGVTEPENEFGEFGEARLIEIVRDHRHLPLAQISELVLAAVREWIGQAEQPDDITLVLARPR